MQGSLDYRKGVLYLIAFNSSLGSLTWGYCTSIFNSVRAFLQSHIFPQASDNQIAFLASALTIGASIGSYNSGKIIAKFGRRKTMLMCDVVSILGSCLSMVPSLPVIIFGRFVSGLVLGVNSTAVPLYNVEMSPLKLKGVMSSISMVVLTFGIMVSLAASFFMSNETAESQTWRVLIGVPILFSLLRISVLLFVFKFETPFYLVLQGKTSEARKVLEIIYTENIDQHLQKVIKDKEAMTSTTGSLGVKDLATPKYRKAFFMGLLLGASLQLSGFSSVFMFFNIFIEESADNDPNTLATFSTLMGFISFLFTLVTATLVEKVGRRPLMVYGTLFLFFIKVLYLLISIVSGLDNGLLKYLMILWPIPYRLSAGTLSFVYISELLPSSGVAIATFMSWISSFLLVQSLYPIINRIGIQGLMFIYTCFTLFLTILFYKYLIESKGKTKAELLVLYSSDDIKENQGSDVEMKRIPLIQK